MTYSILDSTGNLVDAFDDHDAAVAALTAIVIAEPDAADDVFLIAQDDAGEMAGETVYGSSRRALTAASACAGNARSESVGLGLVAMI